MAKWVGFIDLLALRHAANIDEAAVEGLLSNFFEVLQQFAAKFKGRDLTVDILSDSAVITFADFDVVKAFYLGVRPEMILRETYFRLGIAAGDVTIQRFNHDQHGNVAGTYFRGAAGMSAYAAQNALNGAGAILVEPRVTPRSTESTKAASAALNAAVERGVVVNSFYFGRSTRPDVESYLDFSMTAAEVGDPISLSSDQSIRSMVESVEGDNDGFTFFDEVYSKYAYTRGLDRFVARKYLSIFFTLLSSIDFSKIQIAEDGTEFSNLPPALCRMFFDGRFRGIERDEDFVLVLLRALSEILIAKAGDRAGGYRIRELLERVPELRWACNFLGRRKTLYRRLSSVTERLVPMKVKDMVLRGMTDLGYLY